MYLLYFLERQCPGSATTNQPSFVCIRNMEFQYVGISGIRLVNQSHIVSKKQPTQQGLIMQCNFVVNPVELYQCALLEQYPSHCTFSQAEVKITKVKITSRKIRGNVKIKLLASEFILLAWICYSEGDCKFIFSEKNLVIYLKHVLSNCSRKY